MSIFKFAVTRHEVSEGDDSPSLSAGVARYRQARSRANGGVGSSSASDRPSHIDNIDGLETVRRSDRPSTPYSPRRCSVLVIVEGFSHTACRRLIDPQLAMQLPERSHGLVVFRPVRPQRGATQPSSCCSVAQIADHRSPACAMTPVGPPRGLTNGLPNGSPERAAVVDQARLARCRGLDSTHVRIARQHLRFRVTPTAAQGDLLSRHVMP